MRLKEIELVYNVIPTGICIVNRNCEVVFLNSGFRQLLQLEDINVDGLMLCDLFPIFEEEGFKERLYQVFEKQTPMFISSGLHGSLLSKCIAKNGTYCEVSIAPFNSLNISETNMLVITVEDSSETIQQIKRQKNLLNYLHKQLKKSEAVKEELNKSREKLQQANEAKDKLFSIIGHDLKTPFAALVAISELLVRTYIEDKERKCLYESIWMASNQGMELVTNLFNWAQSQSNKIVAIPKDFNLLLIIEELGTLFQLSLRKKNISLKKQCQRNTLYVSADEDMIKVVLQNLISNAIKFSPIGASIEIIIQESKEGLVKITVRDQGIGIKKETVNAILNRQRIEPGLGSQMEKGTGLGLAVCHEFLLANNTMLEIKRAQKQGSDFSFKLPEVRDILPVGMFNSLVASPD